MSGSCHNTKLSQPRQLGVISIPVTSMTVITMILRKAASKEADDFCLTASVECYGFLITEVMSVEEAGYTHKTRARSISEMKEIHVQTTQDCTVFMHNMDSGSSRVE